MIDHWTDQALCADLDPRDFDEPSETSIHTCPHCPVQEQCLAEKLHPKLNGPGWRTLHTDDELRVLHAEHERYRAQGRLAPPAVREGEAEYQSRLRQARRQQRQAS